MDEQQPVADSEFVYRRIHRVYYQAGLPIPIQSAAFRPTANDATGLSVFRATFAQPMDILASLESGKQNDYYVVRLSVQEMRWLGVSVVAEPQPNGPAGHAIIPELSLSAYQADKQRLKVIQLELAKLASAAVVHQPS